MLAQSINASPPLFPDSISLLPNDTLKAFYLSGAAGSQGKISIVAVENTDFETAIRAETLKKPAFVYDLQLAAPITASIKQGDVINASFWVRTVESASETGFIGFTFEGIAAPYNRSFGQENSAGAEWKLFQFPFKAIECYDPGQAVMNLRIGYAPQIIEIGGISLRNLGQEVALDSLPATRGGYIGIEADAPWRKAALERIERIRKADLKIIVRDENGAPVPNAEVKIEQTRSSFVFGSAVGAKFLIANEPDDLQYQQIVREQFNRVTFENDLKWHRWVRIEDRVAMHKGVEWLQTAGIDLKGHVLIWPSWRNSPPFVKALNDNKVALKKLIADHITEEASAMRGLVKEWDVLNEPFSNHDVMDLLGPQVQAEWFKLARNADPDAKLYLNDYGIIENGGRNTEDQQHFESTIEYLLSQDAPIDGLGLQGHFGWNLTAPEKMLEILDRLARFGLAIQITEFDVKITNENLQADFTRDFLIAMFSHPAVSGVTMWGFWEGRHFSPSAALWRKDWTIKPNGKAWIDLVQNQWRTDETLSCKEVGEVKLRAFQGEYRIIVSSEGQTKIIELNLPENGATLERPCPEKT